MNGGSLLGRLTIARLIAGAAVAAALIATIEINFHTISEILRAPTRVPWADEWEVIQEFILYKQGNPLWPTLWASHWGHRFVVPRLVFFANLQWGSRASLIWLTCGLQLVQIAFLCILSWVLVGRKSRLLFGASVAAILSLMISPFQMENFIWSMQFTFPLVYLASGISFLCLALYSDRHRPVFLVVGALAAVVASYTMANGILVWPVLVAQAAYLKMPRRFTVTAALFGAGLIASYCWHYQLPPLGMGFMGMLRRPIDGTLLIALLLGAALKVLPLRFGIAATLMAIAGAIYTGVSALRDRNAPRSWLSALVAFHIFLLLAVASTVAGRMSPQWLAGNFEVPSRCFTLIQEFWCCTAILILYATCHLPRSRVLAGFYAVLYLCIMFPERRLLISAGEDWSDFFRGIDAVGAAFIVEAPDEKLLSILWPIKPQREEIVTFMRKKHLGVFAEPRSAWLGRYVLELFPVASADRCIGFIERILPLADDSPARATWRIEGWAWNTTTDRGIDYLLIANPVGLVVGLARGGFRHGYFPGLFVDSPPAPLPDHTRFKTSEWLGYVGQPARSDWTVYGLAGRMDQVCVVGSSK